MKLELTAVVGGIVTDPREAFAAVVFRNEMELLGVVCQSQLPCPREYSCRDCHSK